MINANITKPVRRYTAAMVAPAPSAIASRATGTSHDTVRRGRHGFPHNLVTLCSAIATHTDAPLYETPITACVEYLTDYYAPDYNPWGAG